MENVVFDLSGGITYENELNHLEFVNNKIAFYTNQVEMGIANEWEKEVLSQLEKLQDVLLKLKDATEYNAELYKDRDVLVEQLDLMWDNVPRDENMSDLDVEW
jgi:predicted HNH restriction endonuclease